ncbi:myelin-oligodendrocyte glycoprotein-like isoform X2 [Anarhichas minor]|uniref:myelin-oligodendrocyte glycoprotein-like isoform X2 n=1 Tax=Anarhichas minor TaxID=65739 RepID=UPI003F7403F5
MSPSGDLVLVSGLFSVVVCTVHGRSQLIGSSQPIVSAVGDDVILPCHVEPQLSVENMEVIWWKPDEPMSDSRYVHRYQNNRVEEDLQMESYVSRTTFTNDLKHGNVSLKIKKVKLSDGGIYRCDVPQLFSDSIIRLVVGAVVRRDCTPQSDPRCISCMNGTFMKKPNDLIRCFLCSSCDRVAQKLK